MVKPIVTGFTLHTDHLTVTFADHRSLVLVPTMIDGTVRRLKSLRLLYRGKPVAIADLTQHRPVLAATTGPEYSLELLGEYWSCARRSLVDALSSEDPDSFAPADCLERACNILNQDVAKLYSLLTGLTPAADPPPRPTVTIRGPYFVAHSRSFRKTG